jgi:hypothetical protein
MVQLATSILAQPQICNAPGALNLCDTDVFILFFFFILIKNVPGFSIDKFGKNSRNMLSVGGRQRGNIFTRVEI